MPFRKDIPCATPERIHNAFDEGKRVRLYDIETGAEHAIAPTGAFETAELIRLIGGNFDQGDLPTSVWQTSVTGSGSSTSINGELIMLTGVTPNSIANVQSSDRAEFVTATFNKAHLAFEMENFGALDVIREFGMFDPVLPVLLGDGVFFRNNGGVFSTVRRRGGVDVDEKFEADFNGGNTLIKDNSIHVYEIVYNAGSALFFQDRKLINIMGSPESVAYNHVHLTLGARIENINGNTVNNTLKTRGFACSRIGSQSSIDDSIVLNEPGGGLLKRGPGVIDSVIITQVGTGGAELEIFDNDTGAGIPSLIIDLTINALFDLKLKKRFNNGLFYNVTGNGFEVILNWR